MTKPHPIRSGTTQTRTQQTTDDLKPQVGTRRLMDVMNTMTRIWRTTRCTVITDHCRKWPRRPGHRGGKNESHVRKRKLAFVHSVRCTRGCSGPAPQHVIPSPQGKEPPVAYVRDCERYCTLDVQLLDSRRDHNELTEASRTYLMSMR